MSEKSNKDGLQIIYDFVTDCANAIREVEGSTGKMKGTDVPARIRSIESGVDTTDANAVAGDIRFGKTAYVNEVKVTGLLEDYDGAFEGEGFEEWHVPEITNVKITPDGKITWDPLDISGVENYSPVTVTYMITINDTYNFNTTSTSANIANYIKIGTNTISVRAKVQLTQYNDYTYDTTEHSINYDTLEILNTILPYDMRWIGTARVNEYIYLFGGRTPEAASEIVQRFNINTQELELLDVKLPQKNYTIAINVDDIIYVYIYNKLYTFDPISLSFTTLASTYSMAAEYAYIYHIDGIIYISCYAETYRYNIQSAKFDTILGLKNDTDMDTLIAYACVGTNIYLMGGSSYYKASNKITQYDTISDTSTQLPYTLKRYIYNGASTVTVGNSIYIFGGKNVGSYPFSKGDSFGIQRVDTSEGYVELLDLKLPYEMTTPVWRGSVYNNDVYFFGGSNGSISFNHIFKFTVEEES